MQKICTIDNVVYGLWGIIFFALAYGEWYILSPETFWQRIFSTIFMVVALIFNTIICFGGGALTFDVIEKFKIRKR